MSPLRAWSGPSTLVVAAFVGVAIMIAAPRPAAADCLSKPGEGPGDCADFSFTGLNGGLLLLGGMSAFGALFYDYELLKVGPARLTNGWKVAGVVTGTLTLAFAAGYLAYNGTAHGGVPLAIVGGALGLPALVCGVVGLAIGDPSSDRVSPRTALLRCQGARCALALPLPAVDAQIGKTSIVLPFVDARW